MFVEYFFYKKMTRNGSKYQFYSWYYILANYKI